MAAILHNRKLFQYYHFSDPSCPNLDDCYFFPDDPPRLPASPPPLSAPVPKVLQFSSLAIVIVVVLASVCLLVSCSAFILKCCTSWTRCFPPWNGSNSSDPSVPTQRERDNLFGENDDQADQTVNHPIWLISTVGLQQSAINTIAIVKFKKEDGLIEGTDCSVCLGEFEEEETLRVLPKCNHAFHIECIDPWLRSHTNCPLCRASIVPNPAPIETPPRVTRSNDSDSSVVELGGIQTEDSSENRGNSGDYEDEIVVNPNVVNEMDDGPLISERRSYSVQIYRDPNSNRFRLMGSASSSRVRPSPCSRFSPMTGPIKRSYSWSVRVIESSDNPICNSRFSP